MKVTSEPQLSPPLRTGTQGKANKHISGEGGLSESRLPVRELDGSDWSAWNAFVAKSPQGTLFHTTDWLQMTGTPFRIYGCFDDHGLAGGMVVEIIGESRGGHSFFTGVIDLAYAPQKASDNVIGYNYSCPYLGVVLAPACRKYVTTLTRDRHLLDSLVRHITSRFNAVYSRMVPEVRDVQPFVSAGFTVLLRYTYRIDVSNLEAAWSNMTDKRRNDIRRAERDGITIDQQGSIKEIVSLLSQRCERQNRVIRFSEFALRRDEMLRNKNRGRCFVARDSTGELAASIYIAWDDKCAYYLHGSYGLNAKHRGAGALALWEAIRYAGSTLNLRQFDLLAAESGPGEGFAREFGGHLTVAYNVNYERLSFSREVKRAIRKLKRIVKSR
jgi:Acetyltransferase (GNAT) domain